MKRNKLNILLGVITCLTLMTSCSDFLTVYPNDSLVTETAITDMNKANAALLGAYDLMQYTDYYNTDLVTFGDVRGDDMGTTKSGDRTANQYTYGHRAPLNYIGNLWTRLYSGLNDVNSLIVAIDGGLVPATTDADKNQLNDIKGQAIALRALFHFDLLRTHAEPYLKNKTAPGVVIAQRIIQPKELLQRSSVEDSYKAVISDLNTAITLLSESKTLGQINRWGAKALLARVYLYQGNWEGAYLNATDVIKNGGYALIPNNQYVASWALETTTESIFEVYNNAVDNGDRESIGYVVCPRNLANKGYGAVSATETFINLMKEDMNDVRLGVMEKNDQGIEYAYVKKYPGRAGNLFTNNIRVIRLSDIYLIAAEAGVYAGKADASSYLNAIRKRANPAVADVTATAELVAKERRKELVGEGHRFFDIIRNLGDKTVTRAGTSTYFIPAQGVPVISWTNADAFLLILPIPQTEVDVNPGITQNAGYPTVK